MQLTKLDIKGFKSFGDRITINFNEGVTAIVGPNGCGKSNVVDAIRWVLGEQSTRMLRSEKMENIIFNGTKNRKPANLAEVSLTFDNTKNILPTEFSQVTITRKLYRNGDSEYRLNDVKCRLKDITDLFLDTGVGADSYSIIELRMIDEIINNKDHSRRNLFEEASGIAKYKVRKKQTISKLRDTQTDLDRVDDLVFEIEKNLKSLENQARKTERYYKIKEQYKQHSLALASLKIGKFRTTLHELETQELAKRTEQTHVGSSIQSREAALQSMKQEALIQEKNLAAQQKATNEHIHRIRTYESDKKVKNEQLRNLQQQEARLADELNQDKQQLNHIAYNVKRLNGDLLEEQVRLDALRESLAQKRDAADALRGQQHAMKGTLDLARAEAERAQQEIHNLEKEIAVLHIQRDALHQESFRNAADREHRQQELDQFSEALVALEQQHESLENRYAVTKTAEDNLQEQLLNTQDRISELNDEINRESRFRDAKQNEYNLTKSLVDNLEGFPESIRFLRKHAQWKKQYPLLSDVLFCKEEYRIAIENYLEPVMNHYVVETEAEAMQAIRLLRDSSRGRAGFFVLEKIGSDADRRGSTTRDHPDDSTNVDSQLIPALDIIRVDARYESLCQWLLRHVYLLRDDQLDETPPLPYPDAILLQAGGQFSKHRLGFGGGSVGLFEGKRIGRVKNLENLAKEIKSANALIEKLEREHTACMQKIHAWKANSQKDLLNELETQINRLAQELISVRTKYEQHQAFIADSRTRKQDIEEKISAIEQELRNAEPRVAELQARKAGLEVNLSNLNEQYLDISDTLTVKSTAFNQENLTYHQQENRVAGIQKDLEYRYSQQDVLEKRLAKNTADYEHVQAEIQHILQHVDDSDEGLIAMYTQRETMEQGLRELESAYYDLREKTNALEAEIAKLRGRKDQIDAAIATLKERENELKISLNALRERLSVEFNIDIRSLIDEETAEVNLSENELIDKTERLKRQLDDFGSINPMAMEAYQEMHERYSFILSEKKDLLDAKNSLLDTIREIDAVAREKFTASFNQVRENFIHVFRSLFNEEDSCDLILTDPEHPLDSDIDIIARPKGKRPLSINQLSGGEKTLTSTALLFALYLLKPAPFCIFDEVDAPLDDTNIDKFNNIIRKFSSKSQFIIVSHNKRTIASTDVIYGVTMVEQGVSRVVAVDMREVA